ncbi:MAG: DUF6614 family protein [Polyangiales bacterium]
MDVYQIHCNLKPGVRDHEWVPRLTAYLERLRTEGKLESFRLLRAKLGLTPSVLREFIVQLEFRDLAQLDAAFSHVATRGEPIESLHHAVNSQVQDAMFALYRDFPDPVRQYGEEKF